MGSKKNKQYLAFFITAVLILIYIISYMKEVAELFG